MVSPMMAMGVISVIAAIGGFGCLIVGIYEDYLRTKYGPYWLACPPRRRLLALAGISTTKASGEQLPPIPVWGSSE